MSQTTVVSTVYGGVTENPTDSILKENFGILNNTMQNVINAVNSSHQESEETQKGILNTIKQVVSFINPLSENFFVYKLIDLLIDALKSLFIPRNYFFSDYFNELMSWFSDRLGFLAYPLELLLNILNKMLSINFSEPIVHIPDIVEPSTNVKIISSSEFNFNSLLTNDILKNVHDIYLVLVDAVVIFGLVNLLKHKMEEVETK